MTEYDMQELEKRIKRESEILKRVREWFDRHPDRNSCSVNYKIAGGHYIYSVEKEDGCLRLRKETGGTCGLLDFGVDVLEGICSSMGR